jgi:ribosome biogenesis GTPase
MIQLKADTALVVRSTGAWYTLELATGRLVKGRLRGKLKLKGSKVTNPVAVGDVVRFNWEDEAVEETVNIEEVLPRENYIIRKSTHKTAHAHIIAANLDQAILVCTLSSPRTSTGFIDRFLVTAESYDIPVLLLFNKFDIYTDEELGLLQYLQETYAEIGYTSFALSAFDQADIAQVKQLVQNKISLLTGHSGVGKSTLLNKVYPNAKQHTAEISNYANKGVHTTTFAEMFRLENSTYLIDTPGIKEFGIADIEEREVASFFPDFEKFSAQCRFYNCQHTKEPGCAVIEAVKNKKIADFRYLSYLSILEDSDNRR